MSTDPLRPDQLRISVEMGGDFVPSAEVADALDRLRAALGEPEDEVAGFATFPKTTNHGGFTFDSLGLQPRGRFSGPRAPQPYIKFDGVDG